MQTQAEGFLYPESVGAVGLEAITRRIKGINDIYLVTS